MTTEELRYPVGRFTAPSQSKAGHGNADEIDADQVREWIDEIERFPAALRAAVEGLSPEQLDTPYRPEGWRVRQVVHHLADSHLNSLVRFKWALTEDRPTIKAYDEQGWAELPDSQHAPIELSLRMLEALHARWVVLLRGLSSQDLAREFVHPGSGPVRLDLNIGIYAWHGRHHRAHITHLAQREGWTP